MAKRKSTSKRPQPAPAPFAWPNAMRYPDGRVFVPQPGHKWVVCPEDHPLAVAYREAEERVRINGSRTSALECDAMRCLWIRERLGI
jgi:hypothetical protein